MTPVFEAWKDSLSRVLQYYDSNRGSLLTFFPKLFLFFVFVNILFYWWAMFTAFPQLTVGGAGIHYFKVQFPVGQPLIFCHHLYYSASTEEPQLGRICIAPLG